MEGRRERKISKMLGTSHILNPNISLLIHTLVSVCTAILSWSRSPFSLTVMTVTSLDQCFFYHCGVWREDSGLLSRPCRKRRPSSRNDRGVFLDFSSCGASVVISALHCPRTPGQGAEKYTFPFSGQMDSGGVSAGWEEGWIRGCESLRSLPQALPLLSAPKSGRI